MVDALSLMPAALPGVVVGVGLILLWNQPFWPRSPYNTLWMLLLSYCCLLLPWPVRYVGSALRQLGPNLEPAARVHGASPLQALRLIVRTGLRRSGHGDGQPDAVDRSGPDADGAGADAAQHARLTTSAQKRRSARKNRL